MSSRQNSNDKLIDLENRLSDCQDVFAKLNFSKIFTAARGCFSN